ncbi:MAG: monodechloroaminopyrrolnitrin synthase PrnB family protein [Pseudomonadales bacterium]
MNTFVELFDHWIRTAFVDMNTELEQLYFAQQDRCGVENTGNNLKQQLVEEGRSFIIDLFHEGNTDEGFDQAFNLLGNVGLYMAACRRHEITEPSRETSSPLLEASGLAMHLGSSLGVTPRFATSHLSTHNAAIAGHYKSFTSLHDESLFLEYNTRGILAYKRAADALVRILPLGISHPVSYHLLIDAKVALEDVIKINTELFAKLDTDRFFYSVRPYYKPYRVGLHEYRGANAGDFAGINEIDILLGLCSANNVSYSQLLVDKLLYMMPADQARLRDVMRRESLLDNFLATDKKHLNEEWYQRNLSVFLKVCTTHGQTAAQHHDQLVAKFIEQPSSSLSEHRKKHITASGPPLPVLLSSLEKLRDLRLAANRDDIPSRYADFQHLRDSLK